MERSEKSFYKWDDSNLILMLGQFIQSISDFDSLKGLIRFMALHPELAFEDQCLLYLQKADAGRFLVHRGIADYYGYKTDFPIALYGAEMNDGRIVRCPAVLYSVSDKEVLPDAKKDISLRAVFDRIGYSLMPDSDASELIEELDLHRIRYPKSWNAEEVTDNLLIFFIDYFWSAYRRKRNWWLTDSTVKNCELEWKRYYRRTVLFMVSSFLGYEKTALPRTVIPFFTDPTDVEWMDGTAGSYHLTILMMLYTEVQQVLEGRHLTLLETDIYRACNGNPYKLDASKITPDEGFDNFVVTEGLLERYADGKLVGVSPDSVHIYPPFRV